MKVSIGLRQRYGNKRNYVQYQGQQQAYDQGAGRLCRSAA